MLARTLATSVLPTPTSPSSSTGRCSDRDTSSEVASPRSARYPPLRRRSVSAPTVPGYSTERILLAVWCWGSADFGRTEDKITHAAAGAAQLALALQPVPPCGRQIALAGGKVVKADTGLGHTLTGLLLAGRIVQVGGRLPLTAPHLAQHVQRFGRLCTHIGHPFRPARCLDCNPGAETAASRD